MPLIHDETLPNISALHMSQHSSHNTITTNNSPSAFYSSANTTHHPAPTTRILNRRKRYLDRHPTYFSPDLESADPLLYDRLVRRHFTPTDREIERRQKGYAGSLEADLLRSEAKLDEATHSDGSAVYTRTATGEVVGQYDDEEELSREEAYERWYEAMERRFLDGRDDQFDYEEQVDGRSEFDDRGTEERERWEEWVESEEPRSIGRGGEGNERGGETVVLEGETGVQDF